MHCAIAHVCAYVRIGRGPWGTRSPDGDKSLGTKIRAHPGGRVVLRQHHYHVIIEYPCVLWCVCISLSLKVDKLFESGCGLYYNNLHMHIH